MVRQVNKYFVCDSSSDLANIRFDDLEGTKAFVKSVPSEEYIYTAGQWQLIAGGLVVEAVEAVEVDKQDVLVSGTNIKTINSTSLLGAGDIVISGGALPDGDYGDVTVSVSGTVMSVDYTPANGYTDTEISTLAGSVTAALADKLDNPTGTPDGTKYLRDDNTWQVVSGGSGLSQQQSMAIASFKI